jgi:hypothetical protein
LRSRLAIWKPIIGRLPPSTSSLTAGGQAKRPLSMSWEPRCHRLGDEVHVVIADRKQAEPNMFGGGDRDPVAAVCAHA